MTAGRIKVPHTAAQEGFRVGGTCGGLLRAAITALEPPGLSHEVERVRVEGPTGESTWRKVSISGSAELEGERVQRGGA